MNVESPRVLDTQFKLGLDWIYFQMDMTPPVLKVGWTLDQTGNS